MRLILFLTTAVFATFLLTATAIRVQEEGVARAVKDLPRKNSPVSSVFLAATRESLFFLLSISYAESFARPFRRRAFNTRFPEAVFVRFKKPCVRARFRFLGWYVRFMAAL